MNRDLLVKVDEVWMNKHCRADRRHPPSEAKSCPYCRVCPHGVTEYGHCEECNKDEAWKRKPVTRAEVEEVLRHLEGCVSHGLVIERTPPKRYSHEAVNLVPFVVAKLRALLRSEP